PPSPVPEKPPTRRSVDYRPPPPWWRDRPTPPRWRRARRLRTPAPSASRPRLPDAGDRGRRRRRGPGIMAALASDRRDDVEEARSVAHHGDNPPGARSVAGLPAAAGGVPGPLAPRAGRHRTGTRRGRGDVRVADPRVPDPSRPAGARRTSRLPLGRGVRGAVHRGRS